MDGGLLDENTVSKTVYEGQKHTWVAGGEPYLAAITKFDRLSNL